MKAGKTDLDCGTKVKITESDDKDLIGVEGEITHPFPGLMAPNTKYIAGIRITNNSVYGDICNLMECDKFEIVDCEENIIMTDTMKESVEYLKGISKTEITDEIIKQIRDHARKYELTDEICAWYKDMDDFYSDWCNVGDLNYTKNEAKERFNEGKESGEFLVIKRFGIIRYAI